MAAVASKGGCGNNNEDEESAQPEKGTQQGARNLEQEGHPQAVAGVVARGQL